MKDAYYFPHDVNARNDPKMPALKLKYKSSGIGMYWIFIEILREQENFKYLIDNDIIWESLASEFMTSPDEAHQFMDDCINKYKLFKTDGEYIWSESLIRRMSKMVESRSKRSDAGKKGMESRWGKKTSEDNNVITTLYQDANSVITNDNKVEDSKEEESKGKKKKVKDIYITAQHLSMTEVEYKKLVDDYGKDAVDTKIQYAENYAKLKNYKSLYLTLNNWLNADIKPQKEGMTAWGTAIRK